MKHLFVAALLSLGISTPVVTVAQEARTLGFARLFTNDIFGDGDDRWRSGSYAFSIIRGTTWTGERPFELGALYEFRLRSEIITPERGLGGRIDRPYVGVISAGVHTHFALGPADASFGADVVAIGPQTGISDLQEGYHDAFSLPAPPGVEQQLADAVHLAGTAELAWPIRLASGSTLRPFVEAQAGVENMLRLGADVIIGDVGHGDMLVRDVVSGQLIRAVEADATGFGFVVGADWAQVWSSAYLPEDQGFAAEESRWRARAGVHWRITNDMSFFYGATYLSEEAVGQSAGQVIGGLKLNFNF